MSTDPYSGRVRLLQVDTGEIIRATRGWADTRDRLLRRYAIIGKSQTHVIVTRKGSGKVEAVLLERYAERAWMWIHPAEPDFERAALSAA